jgi:hypothetical protein
MTTDENKSYLNRLFNGETSLSFVFWFWFIFISFIIELFFEIIFMESIYANNKSNYMEFFLYLLILIYSIIIFIIIFKTANNYKKSKIWSFLARFFVSINLFFSINLFIEISKFYFFEDYAIEKEVENFRQNLPMQIDMNTTLIDIYKKEQTIYYKYELFEVSLENELLKNKFKRQIQDSLCEDTYTLDLLKREYVLDYKYFDNKNEEIMNIKTDKKTCGDSIFDLEILNTILKKQGMI